MILYFIRHAQSANNALLAETLSHTGRQDDPPLTAVGQSQAECLGDFLVRGNPAGGYGYEDGDAGFGITCIYTSLMLRAVQTASAVGQCLNLHPIGLEMLHESGGVFLGDDTLGEVEPALGKSVEYFQREFPELVIPKDLNSGGWWGKRPYENLAQRQERAGKLLSFLLEQHGRTSDRIALISHGDFLNVFLSKIVGFPTSDGIWFSSHNTGITRIDFRERRRRIVYQNRTSHLPPSLLTA